MKLNIEINENIDPDFAGEVLLNQVNPHERWGYMTHHMGLEWMEKFEDEISLEIRTICCGCFAQDKNEYSRIQKYVNHDWNVVLYLYWDGDGTIVFEHLSENWILYNDDCKKSYGWKWVKEDSWINEVLNEPEYYNTELVNKYWGVK
jgi:hypothetical protein